MDYPLNNGTFSAEGPRAGLRRRRSETERVSRAGDRREGATRGRRRLRRRRGAPTISIYTTPAISSPHFGGPSREVPLWRARDMLSTLASVGLSLAPRAPPALRAALGAGSARPAAAAAGLGGRCGLAQMSAFVGPRQLWIEEKLEEAFSPVHMEVMNESHGRVEDECALARPHARACARRHTRIELLAALDPTADAPICNEVGGTAL